MRYAYVSPSKKEGHDYVRSTGATVFGMRELEYFHTSPGTPFTMEKFKNASLLFVISYHSPDELSRDNEDYQYIRVARGQGTQIKAFHENEKPIIVYYTGEYYLIESFEVSDPTRYDEGYMTVVLRKIDTDDAVEILRQHVDVADIETEIKQTAKESKSIPPFTIEFKEDYSPKQDSSSLNDELLLISYHELV